MAFGNGRSCIYSDVSAFYGQLLDSHALFYHEGGLAGCDSGVCCGYISIIFPVLIVMFWVLSAMHSLSPMASFTDMPPV